MTDKELLKYAAAAIGRHDLRIVSEFIQGDFRDGLWDDLNEVVWNPLTDDGDAFRLACNLKISIIEPDNAAAVRREIVATAAMLAKT